MTGIQLDCHKTVITQATRLVADPVQYYLTEGINCIYLKINQIMTFCDKHVTLTVACY